MTKIAPLLIFILLSFTCLSQEKEPQNFHLTISPVKQGGNGPELEFFSICAMPTQMLDWGKNKRNAKAFLKHFNTGTPATAQAA